MQIIVQFLVRYARQNIPYYALGLVMLFITNYAVVRIPTLIGDALTILGEPGPSVVAQGQGLARELMLWAVIVVVARTLSRVLFFNPGREVEFRIGLDLFRHLLRQQRPFYMRRKIGEIVSIATNDTSAARLLVGFAGLQVANVAFALPLHVYRMWVTDWVLTLWCLAPVAIGGIYTRQTVRSFYGLIRHSQERLARLSDRILESYAGIATTRAHVGERAIVERFDERNQDYLSLLLRIARIRAFAMPALGFSGLVATGIVLWVGGDRVIAGHMEIGDMATFTTLLISLVGLLMSLAWVLAAISRGIVSLGRIDDVMQTPVELPPVTEADFELRAAPALELRALSFSYPDDPEPALADISISLAPGATLGIFGRTGAGKTTLINLLARVYTPAPGAVLIDGRDMIGVELDVLRRAMAVVPQDPFLFSTTLRENIRLRGERSRRGPDDDDAVARDEQDDDPRLQQVLEEACLVDDLRNLPSGLDTVVGERGVMLSGGQRQRTALARALYQRPHLLLLDDVLSAVDQGTEARLVAAIRGLQGARGEHHAGAPTTVIVSHRTSVLEHADEIVVLERGRITERGTHAELLARGGHYAETHLHQSAQGEDGAAHG
ncbi:MAG: ABC transporter ATP-binding protein [Myxococcales bacterium]|nr:ABC transporter ATP-binding protein [Myxococcales bacterium]MCB9750388.1 ABC transporter ATP-binding protein [Myxococcales bacterium]